ncbi:right-handed parallel beta-helix repeat-containing protein [Paenibacillus sp. HWE-109]|uniref:golvesin C-terminal-like domain-containing protein n=1 Tax=Paenibacillus sp. HWE-109 TaxID=1306526 RepID=UPI001EDDFBC5|nr:right-handed parallel beta-helix repeat-containing protein [Paenibacillus sp. HWE-109]UKS26894.1 right-handed parallel beta-helix repeat-containing protein [Paenibacillus sp. HWE-109]
MMKRVSFVFSVVLAMAFLLIASGIIHQTEVNAAATTFYVSTTGNNNNPGTLSQPFATIQKGVNAAGAAGPGSTVIVRGGTYNVTAPINISTSGASGSPITIKAYRDEIPIISGQNTYPSNAPQDNTYTGPTVTNDGVTYLSGQHFTLSWNSLMMITANYITIDGLEIAYSYGGGIHAGSSGTTRYHHIIIQNCNIHENRDEAVQLENVDYFTLDGNTVWENANFARFSRLSSELNWPLIIMIRNSAYGTIKNSTIYHNWGEGVGFWYDSHDVVLEDSSIYDNYALEVYIDKAHDVTIQRNMIYNTGNPIYFRGSSPSMGIAIADEDFQNHVPGYSRKIINNFLKGNSKNFEYWNSGITGTRLNNELIAGNTFLDSTNTNISIVGGANHTNTRIENNIFKSSQGTLQNVDQNSQLLFSNNCWSGVVTGVASNVNDVIGDPMLAGGTFGRDYFKLRNSSPCIGKGKNNLADVSDDFFKTLRSNPPSMGGHEYQEPVPTVIIVDNSDPTGVTQMGAATWAVSSYSGQRYGADYLHDGDTGKGSKSVKYAPNLLTAGSYDVYLWWNADTNRASNVPVTVNHAWGATQTTVNQQAGGGIWNWIGSYPFSAGTSGSVIIGNTGTTGYVVADAVKFVPRE